MSPGFEYFSQIEVELKKREKPVYKESRNYKEETRNKYEKDFKIWLAKVAEAQKAVMDEVRGSAFWLYNDNIYRIPPKDRPDSLSREEQSILVKEAYFRQEKRFQRLRKEIELFEKLESSTILNREPIPEEVRFAVWRRDGGKCVQCGRQEDLEFDHVIPVSKGGSNTARNVQLLCMKCNREKSNRI